VSVFGVAVDTQGLRQITIIFRRSGDTGVRRDANASSERQANAKQARQIRRAAKPLRRLPAAKLDK